MVVRRLGRAASKDLPGSDVARWIDRLQDVVIPPATHPATAGDLLRINDAVREVAESRLDFFDVPAHFQRVMKDGKA